MKTEVRITEKDVDLSEALMYEAAPTPGAVGLIAISFLVDTLKAKKIGGVYSPFLPHVSLVDNNGVASAPVGELYLCENKTQEKKILFLVRNFPIEEKEGGYIMAKAIYDFCENRGISKYGFLGGVKITGKDDVHAASNQSTLLDTLLKLGAMPIKALDELPLDKLSSFLVKLFTQHGKEAFILISESSSYLPDPLAAKRLLRIMAKLIGLELNLSRMDEEIEKYKRMREELERTFISQLLPPKKKEKTSKEPSYIG